MNHFNLFRSPLFRSLAGQALRLRVFLLAAALTAQHWCTLFTHHDANHVALHRLKHFRILTLADSPPDLAGSPAK